MVILSLELLDHLVATLGLERASRAPKKPGAFNPIHSRLAIIQALAVNRAHGSIVLSICPPVLDEYDERYPKRHDEDGRDENVEPVESSGHALGA